MGCYEQVWLICNRGAEAGLAAGLIYGLVLDIVIFAVGLFFFSEVAPKLLALLELGVTLLAAVAAVAVELIVGTILDLIYAAAYDIMPGSSTTKGWMIG